MISPGGGRPALKERKALVRDVGGCLLSNFRSIMLMAASPPALLVQPPRVAMLFELRDSVVRDGVTLVLGQSFFQTAHDLSGASKREATSVKA